jgi:hypothetical protein
MVLSPDGRNLYLSGCSPRCDRILAVDTITGDQREILKLEAPEELHSRRTALALSADGKMLAAISVTAPTSEQRGRSRVFQIAVDGSARRDLADIKSPGRLSWANDGTLFAASESGLVRIPPSGSAPEIIKTITSLDVAVSPDGASLAVETRDSSLPVLRTIDNVPALLKAAR